MAGKKFSTNCRVLLSKRNVVGRVFDSRVYGSAEQLLGRLGDLDVTVVATNLPLLTRNRVKQKTTTTTNNSDVVTKKMSLLERTHLYLVIFGGQEKMEDFGAGEDRVVSDSGEKLLQPGTTCLHAVKVFGSYVHIIVVSFELS